MAEHPGVAEATEFRTGDLVYAWLGCLEPRMDLTPRDDVLLQAEVRQEEAVDDVL